MNRTNVEILPELKNLTHSNLPVLGNFQESGNYCLPPAKMRRKKVPLPIVKCQNMCVKPSLMEELLGKFIHKCRENEGNNSFASYYLL